MKTLNYQKTHLLSQLHDELIASGITPERVEGKDDQIWLTVADDASEPAINALVASHIPSTATQPTLRQLADEFTDAVQAATTIPQLKAAILKVRPILKAIARGSQGEI